MAMSLPDNGCMNHTISLSHLITEGMLMTDTPWKKFEVLGLSDRDHHVYILAFSESAIGVFIGSPLIPNSWKLKSKFLPPTGIERIELDFQQDVQDISCFPKCFSCDFDQIGLVFTISTEGDIADHVIHHHMFAIFDLNTSHWQQRLFHCPGEQPFFQIFHTCIGWLGHHGRNDGILGVYQLSLDTTQACPLYVTHPPLQADTNGDYDVPQSSMLASKDSIYFFPACWSDASLFPVRPFMLICHLDREGVPWIRYNFDSIIYKWQTYISGTNYSTWGSLPLINDDFCRSNRNTPTICANCPERMSDPSFDPFRLKKIHTFELDSGIKLCQMHKYGQFWGLKQLVRRYWCVDNLQQSVTMTKSKLFSLVYSHNNLMLYTVSFRNVPSLKELSSLAVIKRLCSKTQVTVVYPYYHGVITLSAFCDGPSEETKKELGITGVLDFGKVQP